MEKLKEQIIEDYRLWVEQALHPLDDHIGIRDIAVEAFKLKLEKLINYANKTESGKISPAGDGHTRA